MTSTNGTQVRHRYFPTTTPPPDAVGPSFELAGRTFRCLPTLPGGLLADLFIASDKRLGVLVEAAVRMVRGALVPEDEAKWDEVIYAKDIIVEAHTIADISTWLVEEFGGAPFVQSNDLSSGP